MAAGAAGVTGRSSGWSSNRLSLVTDTGPLAWLSASDGCLSSWSSLICSSSVSDQAVARCWLILVASERLRRAYRSLVVADMRQYNDRAGWLLLAWPFMRSVLVTFYLRR